MSDTDLPRIAANGTLTAYREYGAGEALVLLHGGEADHRSWLPFVPHLGDGIRAIVYDQRDTGGTENADGAYKMEDLADDCAALIEALGIGPAHVYGQSFGGMLAMHVAIRHPSAVRSVVLGSTSPGGEVGAACKAFLKETAVKAVNAGLEERTHVLTEIFLGEAFRLRHPEIVEEMASRPAVVRPPEARYRRWAAWWGHDCTALIHRIVAPTLVIHGTDDRAVPLDNGLWIAEHIRGSRVVPLVGHGHAIALEARARVATLVREFVLSHAVRDDFRSTATRS